MGPPERQALDEGARSNGDPDRRTHPALADHDRLVRRRTVAGPPVACYAPGMSDPTHEGDFRLANGTAPAAPEDLFRRLRDLGIKFKTMSHPPVFTVDQAKAFRGKIEGAHVKNLVLRNKKGAMWLVVCGEDRELDLKALGELLGAGRFSFGSTDRLAEYLGVVPGAVTPFAIINDRGGQVRVVLEKSLLQLRPLNFHPLDNAMTTSIDPDDLVRFLVAESHTPEIVDLTPAARSRPAADRH